MLLPTQNKINTCEIFTQRKYWIIAIIGIKKTLPLRSLITSQGTASVNADCWQCLVLKIIQAQNIGTLEHQNKIFN